MLARGFQARDRTLGCTHTLCHGVLRETGAGTSFEHLTGDLVFQFERLVRLSEALSRTSLLEEGAMVVGNGFVLQFSHPATSSGAYAPTSAPDRKSTRLN